MELENYIVIDCSKSDMEFIKNEILNSKLAELYDLSDIDWLECERFALNNQIKEVCDHWNNKKEWETTLDLAEFFKISRTTIAKYLKKGTKLKWCHYNGQDEAKKARVKGVANMIKNVSKEVEVFNYDNKESLGVFASLSDLEKRSKSLFGTVLLHGKVSLVCNGKKIQYKGYTFKYV